MRKPVVAGSWYSGSPEGLRRQIEGCFLHSLGPGALPGDAEGKERHILGLVSPHAGYAYSGPVAAHGFFHLASESKPQTVIVLGPNHTGLGAYVSVSAEDAWRTPLGDVELDTEAGKAIVDASRWAEWDDVAHEHEHSVELQLPFLQYVLGSGFKVVLVTMMRQNLELSRELGRAIAQVLRGQNSLVIASSDFTHHERHDSATEKDHLALDAILALDPERLSEVIDRYHISTCGPGPVMTMLTTCKQLGASAARLLQYADSGDVTGDYHRVVGYASVSVSA